MNQRAVAIVADYLSRGPRGRVVRVMKTGEDDYLMGIEDVRDGRVQLVHSTNDLETIERATSCTRGASSAARRHA